MGSSLKEMMIMNKGSSRTPLTVIITHTFAILTPKLNNRTPPSRHLNTESTESLQELKFMAQLFSAMIQEMTFIMLWLCLPL